VKVWICHGVTGCIGCRQRHGDDKIRPGEAQKDEYEDLALPAGEQIF
jgi:hypothetical protein